MPCLSVYDGLRFSLDKLNFAECSVIDDSASHIFRKVVHSPSSVFTFGHRIYISSWHWHGQGFIYWHFCDCWVNGDIRSFDHWQSLQLPEEKLFMCGFQLWDEEDPVTSLGQDIFDFLLEFRLWYGVVLVSLRCAICLWVQLCWRWSLNIFVSFRWPLRQTYCNCCHNLLASLIVCYILERVATTVHDVVQGTVSVVAQLALF